MPAYTAITFSPVQGFIEKSRKLRDLFGASAILSYLSYKVVEAASSPPEMTVISPGGVSVGAGMTNRILIKGDFSEELAEQTIKSAWKAILKECREWIEWELPAETYYWEKDWKNWGAHTWDISWGQGDSISEAMRDLETRKLSRNWTGINWIGESSSLTGTDAIAWPELGSGSRNPKNRNWQAEKDRITQFYRRLACVLEGKKPDGEPEGKFIDPTERLSIPELVKRMVTLPEIAREFAGMNGLEENFTDITRKPEAGKHSGQWTGWFMGDGDKIGKKLTDMASDEQNGDSAINTFSTEMRKWGAKFQKEFHLGRIIYAGGDDFLGVIYSPDVKTPRTALEAYQWLKGLNAKWHEHKQGVNLSVGFVWAAPSVPQRDVLQHCREAEKIAKSKGRDRITIRILFNSGQYVQWTCPWDYLHILDSYTDRDGELNWSHVYGDLAHLKARRAIDLSAGDSQVSEEVALALFNIYFNDRGEELSENRKHIVGDVSSKFLISWIDDLILVGWQLCSDT